MEVNTTEARQRQRSLRRHQKKAARVAANEARIRELGALRVRAQKDMRATYKAVLATPTDDTLHRARQAVISLVQARHAFDEVAVDIKILQEAVDTLVTDKNYDVLTQLAEQPLKFDPAKHPDVFEENGAGPLYIRQSTVDYRQAIDAYEARYPADKLHTAALREQGAHEAGERAQSLRLKYVGQTFAEEGVAVRLEQDEVVAPSSRLGNWISTLQEAASSEGSGGTQKVMTTWSLRHVKMPATDSRSFVRSEVSQEMERTFIALAGLSALNSAPGGLSILWDTDIYADLTDSVLKDVMQANPTAAASAPTASSLSQPGLGATIRAALETFVRKMQQEHPGETGAVPSGWRWDRVLQIASSALSSVRSVTLMKDITREEVIRESSTNELHYFGQEAGPGPKLERRLVHAIDRRSTGNASAIPLPFQLRFYWDLWMFLSHVLIYEVVSFLASLIHIVRPQIIRIQSSKVANLFITGYIVDVEKVKDITWEALPVSAWLDKVCQLYILAEPDALLVLSLDPGSIKYDPLLGKHRCRLLYLSILLQRGAEILIGRGLTTHQARERLLGLKALTNEIARVKQDFKVDQHALWSLRNQKQLDEDARAVMSERASERTRTFQTKHPKAVGTAGSQERIDTWLKYASSGPSNAWTITSQIGVIPCPGSLQPRSEKHRVWYEALREGTNLVLAAAQYDAPRSDPDQHDDDFDWYSYIETRRHAHAQRGAELQLVVSGVSLADALAELAAHGAGTAHRPIYEANCALCGLAFLADDNTQHRCQRQGQPIGIAKAPHINRKLLLVATDVLTAFGSPQQGLPDGMTMRPVREILARSDIWFHFAEHAHKQHPAALAELEAIINVEPLPMICLPQHQDLAYGEYDALIWAVTTLWSFIYGEASWGTYDLQRSAAASLATALQQDAVGAVVRAVCDEDPPCAYDQVVASIDGNGKRRYLQHEHVDQHKRRKPKPRVVSDYRTVFDLDLHVVRGVLAQERRAPPSEHHQSALLWGLGEHRRAFVAARPRAHTTAAAPTPPAKKHRRSTSHFNDEMIAMAMSEHGYVTFPERQRLTESLGVTRRELTDYLSNNDARLRQLRDELRAGSSS
ncbi:hypothetical protein OC835_007706 [Tilletia horrida]|nr:hypothetical protein OC835_007706 [Tilletia horrida]